MSDDGRRSSQRTGVSLLVRNLPLDVRAEDVRDKFTKYGDVRDVYLPRDYYSGRPRGFGFVEFADDRDAEDAVRGLDGSTMGGREISVVHSKESRKTPRDMSRRDPRPPIDTYRAPPAGRSSRRSRHSRSRSRSRTPRRRHRSSRRRSRSRSRSQTPPRRRRDSVSPVPRRPRSTSRSPIPSRRSDSHDGRRGGSPRRSGRDASPGDYPGADPSGAEQQRGTSRIPVPGRRSSRSPVANGRGHSGGGGELSTSPVLRRSRSASLEGSPQLRRSRSLHRDDSPPYQPVPDELAEGLAA